MWLTSIAATILYPQESIVSFHSGKPSGITGSALSSYTNTTDLNNTLRRNQYHLQTHAYSRKTRDPTWKRVFDGLGPILQKYLHLRSAPTGACGWCSLGIAFSFSCISSSTKLLGTSTLSGVTPTYNNTQLKHFTNKINNSTQPKIKLKKVTEG